MASSLVLKRLVSANLPTRTSRPLCPAASDLCSRFLNTNAAVRQHDDNDRSVDYDRRPRRPLDGFGDISPFPFSDVFAPFSGRSLSQLLNWMDRAIDSPIASSLRRNWDVKETNDGVHIRADMPGIGKEDVKVYVENNTLVIKGESKQSSEEEDDGRRYSSRIEFPDRLYKTDAIKAEMKNGVLKVFVPKIKEEERTDAIHVKVD